ncbi:MAG: tape measure protein [Dehalococcoidales bacterium]
MVDSTIRIIVDPSGAVRGTRIVNRSLDTTTTKAQATTSAVQFLRRAIGLLGVGLAVRQIVAFADTFTQLQNRIRVAGVSTENLGLATERLLDISRRTRTDLESNVALFQRLGIAQQQLSATTEELFEFVENVGTALSIQGAAAGTARGAILQLSQAVGSGIVRGEEFNSILEGAFPVALAAARGIDRFEGSVSKLRSAVIAGEVTSTEFFRGLLSQGEALAEQFAQTTPTISQAFTVLNNELTVFIGSLDTAGGLTASFARAVIDLSLNLDTAVRVIGVFIGALAPAILSAIAAGLRTAAVAALSLAAAIGPLGLIAAALSAAAVALALFGDRFKPVEGSIATLEDIAVATFQFIEEAIVSLADNGFGSLTDAVDEFATGFGIGFKAIAIILEAFQESVFLVASGVINSFRAMLESARTLGEVIGNIITGDIAGAAASGGGLAGRLSEIFSQNVVADVVQQGINLVDQVSDAILQRAEQRRREIEARSTQPGGGGFADEAASQAEAIELTKQQVTALRRLQDQLDPVAAAQRELAEAQELLNVALAAGAIDAEEFADLNTKLSQSLKDQLDPLAAVNRELEQERELLGLSNEAREVEVELRAIENTLREQGISLSEVERDALRDNLQALSALNEQLETQNQVLESIRGPQIAYGEQLAALDSLLMDGKITFEEFDEAVKNLRLTLLDQNDDFASGIERGLLRAEDSFNDFASQAESAVTNAFRGMEDSLTDFITSGKASFSDLADSILEDILRIVIRAAILGPITEALTGTGSGGGTGGGTEGLVAAGIGAFAGSFQGGGSFTVPGVGGQDSRLVQLQATPGEEITVSTPGNRGGRSVQPPITMNFNISTPNPSAFRSSQNQVLTAAGSQLARILDRNNT